jgi:hypothetical protein
MDHDMERLRQKLREVCRKRPRAFGAEAHQFKLEDPVPEPVVAAFEATHHIHLPVDYRAFITTIASGGAGPAYGLVPFEETTTCERDLPEAIVGAPFPLVEAYNPYDDPALADYRRREASGELDDDEYAHQKAAEVAGTLVLCHEGCGHLHLLVVNGPAFGQMWIDGTDSDGGYAPLGVGFLAWYERWLDGLLSGGDGTRWLR